MVEALFLVGERSLVSLPLFNLALELVEMKAQHSLAFEISFGINALVVDNVAFKLFNGLGHGFYSRSGIGNWDENN